MCGRGGRRAGAALLSTLLLGLSAAMAAQEPSRRPWNELDTSWVTARLGFAAMEDGAFYSQDAANEQQVGDLSAEQLFRLDDLSVSGLIKLRHPWRYEIAGNYRGLDPTESRTWTFTNVNVSIPIGDLANVAIGKQKEGLGLEMTENARDLPFMELSVMSTASTFFESHVVGVRFSNAILGGRMTWSGGWFNNWLDDDLSFSESGQIFAGRVTGLAMDQDGGRELLHLGVSAVYREAPNGSFKVRSIPEVYEAPDFVDTGSFPAGHATSVGGELAAVQDAFTLSAEYMATYVSSPQTGNPDFSGFYVMATYALTGETRPYDHETGAFGMIRPSAPFSFKHGGCGAWEVGARYSKIDLTSGTVNGGVFDRWSGALSWYPTAQWRFEFNYGYGRLDRAGLVGHTNFYQLRLQFQL
jgi:phosphate-selective porin OprO and OprP